MAGNIVEKFTVNHLVCVREGCVTKSIFNKNYLSSSYPSDIFQNILLAKAIFSKEAYIKTESGFSQHIESKEHNIVYRVEKNSTYFKDRVNKIMIKIRDIKD